MKSLGLALFTLLFACQPTNKKQDTAGPSNSADSNGSEGTYELVCISTSSGDPTQKMDYGFLCNLLDSSGAKKKIESQDLVRLKSNGEPFKAVIKEGLLHIVSTKSMDSKAALASLDKVKINLSYDIKTELFSNLKNILKDIVEIHGNSAEDSPSTEANETAGENILFTIDLAKSMYCTVTLTSNAVDKINEKAIPAGKYLLYSPMSDGNNFVSVIGRENGTGKLTTFSIDSNKIASASCDIGSSQTKLGFIFFEESKVWTDDAKTQLSCTINAGKLLTTLTNQSFNALDKSMDGKSLPPPCAPRERYYVDEFPWPVYALKK